MQYEADYDDICFHDTAAIEGAFRYRRINGYQLVTAISIPARDGNYEIVRYLWSREVTND